MKKILSIILTLCMLVSVFALASCKKEEDNVLVIGMTEYAPMNYKDADGNWTGFDTEFALAVAEKLGMEVEFSVIEWNTKWTALSSGKIDCVWNGMTITDEALANASVTDPYIRNAQVAIMKSDVVDNYADAESLKDLTFAVESSSAGHTIAKGNGYTYTEYTAMSDALLAVKAGKADACIIDRTMANTMTGEGTDYDTLAYKIVLSEEEYGIAFPKDSELTAKVNKIMKELKEDGTLQKLAEKYGVNLAE